MENLDDPEKLRRSLTLRISVFVVTGLLHPAAGAVAGMSLWTKPGHLVKRDTALLCHSFMVTIRLPSGDRQLTPSPRWEIRIPGLVGADILSLVGCSVVLGCVARFRDLSLRD
ncbi:hypothetical protein EVAR_89438_1 [Eumeta japonica]|uniref:Uncharacterized protein n=1 Tax=Eumeta variegata TaxID=151549 RepID=A0A4C1Z5A3_EUMVA|nr:hypothetical protein EVAR_89438_1 [Eumeta japonica]